MRCWLYLLIGDHPWAELLLVPLAREKWLDYWLIQLAVRNEPNAVAFVAEQLKEFGVNIEQASGRIEGGVHTLRFGVDCRRYVSPIDGSIDRRRGSDRVALRGLRMRLEVKLADCIEFRNGTPNLDIRRSAALWRLDRQIAANEISLDGAREHSVRAGVVRIPSAVGEDLRLTLARASGVTPERLKSPLFVESSDEALQTVRVLVMYEELGFATCSVRYRNVPGAMARVTEWLRENRYDLMAERQVETSNGWNLLALVLRDLQEDPGATDGARMRARLMAVSGPDGEARLEDICFKRMNPAGGPNE
jgi:hypothetical protein